MSRVTLKHILPALRFYLTYDNNIAARDLLRPSRVTFQHFQRKAVTIAIPFFAMSSNKDTFRCQARTSTRRYMKSKLIKFRVCLYAKCDWNFGCLYSIADRNTNKTTTVPPVASYCKAIRGLRGVMNKHLYETPTPVDSPAARRALQIVHAPYVVPRLEGLLVEKTNFYTRNRLAVQIWKLTAANLSMLETAILNNIESLN